MKDRDIIYLKHIRDAILGIEKYLEGKVYSKFKDDDLVLDGEN